MANSETGGDSMPDSETGIVSPTVKRERGAERPRNPPQKAGCTRNGRLFIDQQ